MKHFFLGIISGLSQKTGIINDVNAKLYPIEFAD